MSAAIRECEICTVSEPTNEHIGELPLESTFPLDPEIQFRSLNRLKSELDPEFLTPAQVDYYQKENLICFLCEFAGKVPYKKIPGIITDEGNLKICNMDVLKMAEKSARIQGQGSREESEYYAWQKAIDGIQMGANRIDIVSPPAIADYMLAFSLQVADFDPHLGGKPVIQVVSRLDEDMNSLEISKKVYRSLANNAGYSVDDDVFDRAEDFITNPIIHVTQDTDSLARAIASIGINQEEIEYSEQYEQEIREALEPMIQEYLRQVEELSMFDSSGWPYEEKKHALDSHLKTMFSFAKRIGRELQESPADLGTFQRVRDIIQLQEVDPHLYYAQAELIRQSERAMITGGTSCPSINSSATAETLSGYSEAGMSFSTAIQAFINGETTRKKFLDCTCPSCEKKVSAKIENNRITCPNCKASAPYKC